MMASGTSLEKTSIFLKSMIKMKLLVILFLIIVCFLWVLESCCTDIQPRKLELEKRVFDEVQDKEVRLYVIDSLETNVKYEVRISYPAVIPTDFVVEIHPFDSVAPGSRKLLNVEQLQWEAQYQSYEIKVHAHRVGVPLDLKRLEDPTPFHIVVNRLYFGCSISTWKLLASCLVVTVIVIKLAYPMVIKYIEAIQQDTKAE